MHFQHKDYRKLRIAREIHHRLSTILPEVFRWDEHLSSFRPVIIQVTMEADLRTARVFLIFDKKELLPFVQKTAPAVRKQLAHTMNARFTPEIRFYDADLSHLSPTYTGTPKDNPEKEGPQES